MTERLTKYFSLLTILLGPILIGASSDTAVAGQNSLSYLFAVYVLTWGIFFIYAIFMAKKQHILHREIEGLRNTIQNKKKHEEDTT
ncbi:hypothetical protein FIM02_02095 [SAR202 cluster bacterium AD-802-E10_MRT_200m]|nr:hypothetical protein [SAR202 cluster bacterium AD-802-E10_MRT_200m]